MIGVFSWQLFTTLYTCLPAGPGYLLLPSRGPVSLDTFLALDPKQAHEQWAAMRIGTVDVLLHFGTSRRGQGRVGTFPGHPTSNKSQYEVVQIHIVPNV